MQDFPRVTGQALCRAIQITAKPARQALIHDHSVNSRKTAYPSPDQPAQVARGSGTADFSDALRMDTKPEPMLASGYSDYLNRAVGTQSYQHRMRHLLFCTHFDNRQRAADTLALENCMRVPVSPSDLESQSGFKRIAKVLSRDWPGPKSFNLSLAREILAKAFGYTGYHDVTRSAKTWGPGEAAPSVPQVQNAIEQAIIEVGQGDVAMAIPASDLKRLVQSLPLHAVSALKASNASNLPSEMASTTTSINTSATPSKPPSDGSTVLNLPSQHGVDGTVASTDQAPLVPEPKAPPILAFSDIQHIVRVVEQHCTLRDRALLAMMLSGLRTSEITSMRVHQVSVSELISGQPLWVAKVKTHKSPDAQERIHVLNTSYLAPTTGKIIEQYLNSSTSSKDDFLFPSSKNSAQPMSARELAQIGKRWSVLAKLELGRISASVLRRSMVAARAAELRTDQLSEMMGHSNPSSTLGYVQYLKPKTSE